MNLIRREGSHGSTYRPRSLDKQAGRIVEDMFENTISSTPSAQASLENGVLRLTLAKKQAAQAKRLAIQQPAVRVAAAHGG